MAVESVLRPRGPTLNFTLETKGMRSVFQEKSSLTEMMDDCTELSQASATAVADTIYFGIRQPEISPLLNGCSKVVQAVLQDSAKDSACLSTPPLAVVGAPVEKLGMMASLEPMEEASPHPEPLEPVVVQPVVSTPNSGIHGQVDDPPNKILTLDNQSVAGRKRPNEEPQSSVNLKKERVSFYFIFITLCLTLDIIMYNTSRCPSKLTQSRFVYVQC